MVVVRPSDWFLVGLAVDPTPGDAFGIRQLAGKYAEIASIAEDAGVSVRHARSSSASSAWVGDAGDIFREKSERMPGELSKANDSYQMVADALRVWAEAVDDTQAQADRGLQQAREAHADLGAAQAASGSAQLTWTSLHAQQLAYQTLVKVYRDVPPPPNVKVPTDSQLRSVDRGVQQAQSAVSVAQAHVSDAEARLAAAKALVMEAKSRHDEVEQRVVHQIATAASHSVKASSIWEAIQDSAGWQALVQEVTIVLTIVSIVAIFVGGPVVWAIIAAATILLMVNAMLSIAQGKNAWGELALLAIGLIPGGRGITSLGRLVGAFRSGGGVLKGTALALKELALVAPKNAIVGTIRSLLRARVGLVPGVVSVIRSIPAVLRDARRTPIQFLKDVSNGLKSDYDLAVRGAWKLHLAEIGLTDPVRAAKLSQGGSVYSGVDEFDVGLVSPGDHLHVGAGGPMGGFAADPSVVLASSNTHDTWGALQVARSEEYGLRAGLYDLQPTSDFLTADGFALHNPLFGPGGGHQRFIPDLDTKLWEGQVVAYSPSTGAALRVTPEPVFNHAGDVVDVYAVIHDTPADVIHLTGNPKVGLLGRLTDQQSLILSSPVRMGIHVAVTPGEIAAIHQNK